MKFLLFSALLLLPASAAPRRVTVGPAGADFASVQAAIDSVPADNRRTTVIDIAPGIWFGHTVLDKPHVTLRGAGPGTLLTYNLGQAMPGADMQPVGWEGAAALLVTAAATDCTIEGLTLENSYGKGMQAQACSAVADRLVFRKCRILGWQDTLKIDAGRMVFEDCYISGHVDFIYGSANAYFLRCEIFCRESGYIVAPSTAAGDAGFLFEECRITFPFGDPRTYLGRPWRNSPAAAFVRCEMGAGIRPEGWQEWNVKPPAIRFSEYASTGAGAAAGKRADWAVSSPGAPPPEISRAAVLGDWQPPAG